MRTSVELDLYTALLPSASSGSDNVGSTGDCCGDGNTGVSPIGVIGDCVKTRLGVLGEVIKVDGGGTGAIGIVVAAAAATAANSSSAFLIKSKSLKVLKVLLLSRDEASDDAFSGWLILEDEGEYLSVF